MEPRRTTDCGTVRLAATRRYRIRIDPRCHPDATSGFDRTGNRIGYGAGHYDRAFAAHPHARRVGIAWSFQQLPQIPVDTWDVPLHAIATDCEWIAI
jgi:5-formyltetrahydrofolate cyclo-ligase